MLGLRISIKYLILLSGIFSLFLFGRNPVGIPSKDQGVAELISQARYIGDQWKRHGQRISDRSWADGSDDFEIRIPPLVVTNEAAALTYWIPVAVGDVAYGRYETGVSAPAAQLLDGFLVSLNPARPDLCREIASAAGGMPIQLDSLQGKWGKGLPPGKFRCVWQDSTSAGLIVPGGLSYLIYRVF